MLKDPMIDEAVKERIRDTVNKVGTSTKQTPQWVRDLDAARQEAAIKLGKRT